MTRRNLDRLPRTKGKEKERGSSGKSSHNPPAQPEFLDRKAAITDKITGALAGQETRESSPDTFSWDQRGKFKDAVHALGGSTDVTVAMPTDPAEKLIRPVISGRYLRFAASQGKDNPGRQVKLWATSDRAQVVYLTDVPVGSKEEIAQVYQFLAECGATFNDANEEERTKAKEVRATLKKEV